MVFYSEILGDIISDSMVSVFVSASGVGSINAC